jgi:hypothetical protein
MLHLVEPSAAISEPTLMMEGWLNDDTLIGERLTYMLDKIEDDINVVSAENRNGNIVGFENARLSSEATGIEELDL